MRIKILLLTVATILWLADGYCEESIYIWKDKNGVLNITDFFRIDRRPPLPEFSVLPSSCILHIFLNEN
jgi:hypothetical protein